MHKKWALAQREGPIHASIAIQLQSGNGENFSNAARRLGKIRRNPGRHGHAASAHAGRPRINPPARSARRTQLDSSLHAEQKDRRSRKTRAPQHKADLAPTAKPKTRCKSSAARAEAAAIGRSSARPLRRCTGRPHRTPAARGCRSARRACPWSRTRHASPAAASPHR